MQVETLKTLKKSFLKLLWPMRCALCSLTAQNDQLICEECAATLPRVDLITPYENSDQIIALFEYVSPIRELITQYKFNHHLMMGKYFSNQFIEQLKESFFEKPEVIFPVPLHVNRLRSRGFNQALELAKPVARYFNIPIDTKTVIRLRDTSAQSQLSAGERKINVKHAFGLSYAIKAKHVGIFDDVVTTGNTVNEIIGLARKAGVEKVSVFCVGRVKLQQKQG